MDLPAPATCPTRNHGLHHHISVWALKHVQPEACLLLLACRWAIVDSSQWLPAIVQLRKMLLPCSPQLIKLSVQSLYEVFNTLNYGLCCDQSAVPSKICISKLSAHRLGLQKVFPRIKNWTN